jgi:hypothetical protein
MDSDKRSAEKEAEAQRLHEEIRQREEREARQRANDILMLLLMAGLP